jgi:hypothetical protein
MTAQDITTIISGWNAAIATIGVVGITLYASGFRVRVSCLIDKNDVIRIRLVNWGRLEGDIESMHVLRRKRHNGHRARGSDKYQVVAMVEPPKDRRIKSGSVRYWWAQIELPDDADLKDVRVRIQTPTGRPRYRKVERLDGPLYDIPADLSDYE